MPNLAIKCIESWKKYCPQYEIKEWNELNFDTDVELIRSVDDLVGKGSFMGCEPVFESNEKILNRR